MKKSILLIAIFLSSLNIIQAQKLDIIPKPVKVEQKEGAFVIPPSVQVIVDKKIQNSSAYIKASLLKNAGINSTVTVGDTHKKNTISFLIDQKMSLPIEGYKLSITKKGVLVKGKSASGVLNGFQTLVQICSAKDVKNGTIPFVKIEDYPRFEWRGMMLWMFRDSFLTNKLLKIILIGWQRTK